MKSNTSECETGSTPATGQNPKESGNAAACKINLLNRLDTLDSEPLEEPLLQDLKYNQGILELQLHEMKNAMASLEESVDRYSDLYYHAPVGYCTLDEQGIILRANLKAAAMLGGSIVKLMGQPLSFYIHNEDQENLQLHFAKRFENNNLQEIELRLIRMDGTQFWGLLTTLLDKDARSREAWRIVITDVSERRYHEDEHEEVLQFIELINTPGDFRQKMAALTISLHNWSRCEAVGIRLKKGPDFPYYETRGFPGKFVQLENQLCTYDANGQLLKDDSCIPKLECMCGNIIRGRFDASKPFFTAHGSFWTNSTTKLLASTTVEDRNTETRNHCHKMGYESVALIPLRFGTEAFGLIQFNDPRPDLFSRRRIAQFERMADSLAIILSRNNILEELQQSRNLLTESQRIGKVGGWEFNMETKEQTWTPEIYAIHETEPSFNPTKDYGVKFLTQASYLIIKKAVKQSFQNGESFDVKLEIVTAKGNHRWVHAIGKAEPESRKYVGFLQDITEQKLSEEALFISEERHHQISQMMSDYVYAGTLSKDGNADTDWISGAFEQITGYSQEEIKTMQGGFASLVLKDDLDKIREIQPRLFSGETVKIEYRIRSRNGEILWLQDTMKPILTENGNKLIKLIGAVTDISEMKRVQEALHESESRVSSLFENAPVGIFNSTLDGKIIRANDEFSRILGYASVKEMIDTVNLTSLAESFYSNPEERSQLVNLSTSQPGKWSRLESEFNKKDGSKIFAVLAIRLIPDIPYLFEGFLEDITERKKAIQLRQESEDNLTAVFNATNESIFLISADKILISLNQVAAKKMGYKAEELIGRNIDEVMPAEIVERRLPLINKALKEGKQVRFEDERNGRWMINNLFPILDDTGKTVRLAIYSQDVTLQKKAQEKADISSKLLQQITDNSLSAIYAFDLEGKFTLINRKMESLLGETRENLVGKTRDSVMPAPIASKRRTTDLEVVSNGHPVTIEEENMEADGIHTYITMKFPLIDVNGKLHGVGGVSTDISDRKKAEQAIRQLNSELETRVMERTLELENVNKELEAFSYSVSHDLQAPLRHISGYLGLLSELLEGSLSQEGKQFMETIFEATHKMSTLIGDLLRFSRTGKHEMLQSNIDMNVLLAEVLDTKKSESNGRNIDWKIASLPQVNCDFSLIRQVWLNLLDNALKFTCKKKKAIIEVGVKEEINEIVFFVRDNGSGFNMAYVDKLFNVFERLHSVSEFEGTGIGLASIRHIINMHGGKTWATGKVDRGATFYFSLPRKPFNSSKGVGQEVF